MAGNIVLEKIKAGARIVDVRTPVEFMDGSYPGAVNIPLSSLPVRMHELEPKDRPIILYCASGARSGQGARLLKAAGFTDVINAGGLDDMPEYA
jgi:phage shock protein E